MCAFASSRERSKACCDRCRTVARTLYTCYWLPSSRVGSSWALTLEDTADQEHTSPMLSRWVGSVSVRCKNSCRAVCFLQFGCRVRDPVYDFHRYHGDYRVPWFWSSQLTETAGLYPHPGPWPQRRVGCVPPCSDPRNRYIFLTNTCQARESRRSSLKT